MRIFIEMFEFLCCFGKNVVNIRHKMKKYSHILQHMWPAEPFFLQCAARKTFFIANAARERI